MIMILSVIACVHGHYATCVEIAVPTPIVFACDDPSYHEKYLSENYPRFEYKSYICQVPPRESLCEHSAGCKFAGNTDPLRGDFAFNSDPS
jgi:hypothetical protein